MIKKPGTSNKTTRKKKLAPGEVNKKPQWDTNILLPPPPPPRKFPFATQERLEIDETGKQFAILPFMSEETLMQFILDENNIRQEKPKKYEEILKFAGKIGMESEQDMMDHDDILLDACRAPPGWYKIQYVKSKQKFYWNEMTHERFKHHPDIETLRAEYLQRINNQCIILSPIELEDLERFLFKLDGDQLIEDIEVTDEDIKGIPNTSTQAIIKNLALQLGMTKVKQMKKPVYQEILMRAIQPDQEWTRVIFQKNNSVGYFSPKLQERSDIHPHIIKLKNEFQIAKEQFNFEFVKEVTDKELMKYFETPENEYDKFTPKELRAKDNIEFVAKLLGMENKDDMQNYKDILIKAFKPYEKWRKIQYDDTNKICYMNMQTKQTSDNHPLVEDLKKELAAKKAAFIRQQEKIAEDRVLGLYKSEFLEDCAHESLKVQGGKISVKKNIVDKQWKVACLQPELIKDSVRRFSLYINKMTEKNKMCIGLVQREEMEPDHFQLNWKSPQEGVYLLTPDGREITQKIQPNDDKKYIEYKEEVQKNYEEKPDQRFGYKQGDELIVEIDLGDKVINYFNKRTQATYVQRIRRMDEEFSIAAALINPQDEINVEPRSNFPIHFCLTWTHPEVDLDLHLTCACGNEISYKSKRCRGCFTYLDKDHITGENAVEHIFIRQLPKNGQTWKYSVYYYEDHTEELTAKNIDYSISVISVDEKENYRTLQRRDGFLNYEEDETFFDYTYSSEKYRKKQKGQMNQILKL